MYIYILYFRIYLITKSIPMMNGKKKSLASLSKDLTMRRTKKIRKITNMTSTMSLWCLTGKPYKNDDSNISRLLIKH